MAKANSRLTHAQRCQIEAYLSTGASHTAIARVIGVHQSTISREIKRNAGSNDAYRAECAQCKRDERVRAAAEQPRKVKPEHYVYIDERLATVPMSSRKGCRRHTYACPRHGFTRSSIGRCKRATTISRGICCASTRSVAQNARSAPAPA